MHVLEGSAWSATMLAVFLSFLSMLSPWYFDKTSSDPQTYSHLGPWLRWNLYYTPSYTGIPHSGHLGEVFTTCRTTTMLAVISSLASLFCLAVNHRTHKADRKNITWLLCAVIAEFTSVILSGVCLVVWLLYLRRSNLMVQFPISFLICHLLSSLAGAVLCLLLYRILYKLSFDEECTCDQHHDNVSIQSQLGVFKTGQGDTIDLDRFAEKVRQREFQEQKSVHEQRYFQEQRDFQELRTSHQDFQELRTSHQDFQESRTSHQDFQELRTSHQDFQESRTSHQDF